MIAWPAAKAHSDRSVDSLLALVLLDRPTSLMWRAHNIASFVASVRPLESMWPTASAGVWVPDHDAKAQRSDSLFLVVRAVAVEHQASRTALATSCGSP